MTLRTCIKYRACWRTSTGRRLGHGRPTLESCTATAIALSGGCRACPRADFLPHYFALHTPSFGWIIPLQKEVTRMRRVPLLIVIALLGVSAGHTTSPAADWAINATAIEACSCP